MSQAKSGKKMFEQTKGNELTTNNYLPLMFQQYWPFKYEILMRGSFIHRIFTLDYNEHRYAAPWAVRSILGDNHSFSAQA